MSESKVFCDRCGEAWSACRCDMRIDRYAYNTMIRTGQLIEKVGQLMDLEIFQDLSKHSVKFHTQGKTTEDLDDQLDSMRRELSFVRDQLDEVFALLTKDC